MIELPKEIASLLHGVKGVGYSDDLGIVLGDAEFIIYFKDNSETPYLVHISEFQQNDYGFIVNIQE
jgi:hypothetical protein